MDYASPVALDISNLEHDWIALIQHKVQALAAYDGYIAHAEQEHSPECAAFFRDARELDRSQLESARQHLFAVMHGRLGPIPRSQDGFGQTSLKR